jgi:hypothetical protein
MYNCRTIKRFEKQENVKKKIDSTLKSAFSSSKTRAALKKQTTGHSAKAHRGLRQKIPVHHNTVKKYLTKIRVLTKAEKSAPKTTSRQQSVIKARLKLLTQKFFSAKSICKCVMDDESYFTVDGDEWHHQSYYESAIETTGIRNTMKEV